MKDENLQIRLMQERLKLPFMKEDNKKLFRQETRKKESLNRRVGKQDNAESTSLSQHFKMEKDRELTTSSQPWITPGTEIAIIGYWKREDLENVASEWKCYYYFNIPNPTKREIRRSNVSNDY